MVDVNLERDETYASEALRNIMRGVTAFLNSRSLLAVIFRLRWGIFILILSKLVLSSGIFFLQCREKKLSVYFKNRFSHFFKAASETGASRLPEGSLASCTCSSDTLLEASAQARP